MNAFFIVNRGRPAKIFFRKGVDNFVLMVYNTYRKRGKKNDKRN